MMRLEIVRLSRRWADATRGVLLVDYEPFCCTLELPWKENQPNISCIPEGHYVANKVFGRSTTGGLIIPETFEVKGVRGRSGILFHIGNTTSDSNGCILIGQSFGYINEKPAITKSRSSFIAFVTAIKDTQQASLVIRWS